MRMTVDIPLSSDTTAFLDAMVDSGHGIAIVGGAVRDALTGRDVRDLDATTDALPEQVRSIAEGAPWCRRTYDVGERFGTLGVVLADGTVIEISRLRGQATAAGFVTAYAADALHRDFTVNAMAALWPGLVLLDPVGGRDDLGRRLIAAPGDPAERFAEDPLRVLRAARFASELGFTVDAETVSAMPAAASQLARVALERIREELTRLLIGVAPRLGLELLRDSDALSVVLPELSELDQLAQPSFHDLDALSHTFATVEAAPSTATLRWAALLHDLGKAPSRTVDPDGRIHFFGHAKSGADLAEQVLLRLRFPNAERTAIVHLVREHMRLGELPVDNERAVDRAIRRLDLWVPNTDPPRRLVSAEDALELELADFAATAHRAEAPERRRVLEAAIAASRERGTRQPPAAPLGGRELMRELGLPEGPPVGAALRAVEDAVAEGRLAADDRAGALEVAREAMGAGAQG